MSVRIGLGARLIRESYRVSLLMILVAPLAAQQAREGMHAVPSVLALDEAVAIALERNAGLASETAQASALATVPSQAASLPDPTIGISAMNFPTDTFHFDQEPMTQLQLSVSQGLPFPGKRVLMREAAEHEAAAAISRIADLELALAADVRSAWWRLFYLDRALEIIDENRSLMRGFIEVAQTKYRVGSGIQSDVLLAQLELSRLMDRRLRTQSMRSSMQASLNHLLNQTGSEAIHLPAVPPNEALPEVPPDSVLLEAAVSGRPRLAAERARVDAARARLDLANRNLRPDFRVGIAYGIRDGRNPATGEDRPDFLSINLGVTVPLYSESKQRSAVEQRTYEVSQRQYGLNDALRSIESAVARSRFDYVAARDQVELGRGAIIPQARQTVESMLAAYQTNQVDFLNVVNTQINLYNAQINYWEALSSAKAALAKLAAAVGRENLYE